MATKDRDSELSLKGKLILFGIAVIVIGLLAIFFNPVVFVPAGTQAVLLKWGGTTNTTFTQGSVHIILPYVYSVVYLNIQTQKYEIVTGSVSSDLQNVQTDVALNYHVDPNQVGEIYNKYGLNYQSSIIDPIMQEAIKSTMASFSAQGLIDNRSLVQQEIENKLTQRLASYNILVQQVSIVNYTFSSQFEAAIEAKVNQSQNFQRQEILLEIARVIANQTVATAIGNATSVVVKARANANATIINAQSQAQAIDVINTALASNPRYLQYYGLSRWNGRVPTVSLGSGSAIPFLNVNVSTGQNSTG